MWPNWLEWSMPETPIERAPGADRLALALDTDDLVAALRMARNLAPWFGTAKVGLELFSAAGPDAVASLANLGYQVFVDLKMFDSPTTVHRASRVVGSLGGRYLTVHAAGGQPMLAAAVEGLAEGAASAGLEVPVVLAVTVLTSESDAPADVLGERVGLAVSAGCGGVVCAATDLAVVRAAGPQLLTVVPGIRPAGGSVDDQRRIATPGAAIAAGADLLVVGRAVTGSADPSAAAAAIVAEVMAAQTNPV
jgi:orotidine-5'-phosphate decarboxylase